MLIKKFNKENDKNIMLNSTEIYDEINNNSLAEYLYMRRTIRIDRALNLSSAETWYDTGIQYGGDNLPYNGAYIMVFLINDCGQAAWQWNERISGILTWYNENTNSDNYDDIPISKAGHARNNHNIRFRVARTFGGGGCRLQICDSIAWNGSAAVSFYFRYLGI